MILYPFSDYLDLISVRAATKGPLTYPEGWQTISYSRMQVEFFNLRTETGFGYYQLGSGLELESHNIGPKALLGALIPSDLP